MDGMRFRNITREDVSTAVAWAADEGWNPGLSAPEAFFRFRMFMDIRRPGEGAVP
jgi:hypothetical protein